MTDQAMSPLRRRMIEDMTVYPPPANPPHHIAFHHSPCAPRPNPHSAGRTTHVPIPAVSSLGGFRTPALGARGTVSHWAGIRNPSQDPKCSDRAEYFRLAPKSRHPH
jgi:hypothetical protein